MSELTKSRQIYSYNGKIEVGPNSTQVPLYTVCWLSCSDFTYYLCLLIDRFATVMVGIKSFDLF